MTKIKFGQENGELRWTPTWRHC